MPSQFHLHIFSICWLKCYQLFEVTPKVSVTVVGETKFNSLPIAGIAYEFLDDYLLRLISPFICNFIQLCVLYFWEGVRILNNKGSPFYF